MILLCRSNLSALMAKDSQLIMTLEIVNQLVHTTHCTHYSLYTLLTVHTTHCTHYSLYTLLTVHATHCTHYSLYTLLTVHATHCTHYSLYTLLTVHTTHCTRYIHDITAYCVTGYFDAHRDKLVLVVFLVSLAHGVVKALLEQKADRDQLVKEVSLVHMVPQVHLA